MKRNNIRASTYAQCENPNNAKCGAFFMILVAEKCFDLTYDENMITVQLISREAEVESYPSRSLDQ